MVREGLCGTLVVGLGGEAYGVGQRESQLVQAGSLTPGQESPVAIEYGRPVAQCLPGTYNRQAVATMSAAQTLPTP